MASQDDSDTALELELEFYRKEFVDNEYPDAWDAFHYLVRWDRGEGGEALLDWRDGLLDALAALQAPEIDQERVQVVAERLRAFLQPAGWPTREARIAAAVGRKSPVRLTIVSQAAELYYLPWELLANARTGERLSELPRVLLRYVWPKVRAADAAPGIGDGLQGPVLFAWSAAGGGVPSDKHGEELRRAYGEAGVIELADVTRAALREALGQRADKPPTILHLLCHGTLANGVAALMFDKHGADPDLVDPNGLRALLGPYASSLRLVVLCACQGGSAASPESRLGSLALALHRGTLREGGIAAVVASRFLFPIAASIEFTRAFYSALREQGLEGAFLAARDAMNHNLAGGRPSLAHASLQLFGAEREATAPVAVPRAPASQRERRWVTLVGCRVAILDVDDQQPLDAGEAAEYLPEVLPAFVSLCRAEGEDFGGHVHTIGGDCFISYGFRKVIERNAPRAVRAAIAVREAVDELSPRFEDQDIALSVYVAVHSGVMYVVPGDTEDGPEFEQGEVTTTVRELLASERPGEVIISGAVQSVVEGYFELESLGRRGVADEQLEIFRVTGDTGIEDPFEARRRRGLTPLVGRDEECRRFDAWWASTVEGAGQVVLLSAPAGVGKSRLLQEFKDRASRTAGDEEPMIAEIQCSPHTQSSALHPVIAGFERRLGFVAGEPNTARLDKIERALTALDPDAREHVPLLAELLSVPYLDRFPAPTGSASERRQDTLELLVWYLAESSAQHPTLFVAEDLHWVDPSTLEFLNRLVQEIDDTRVLALLSYRPHFDPPWDNRSDILRLEPLARAQVEQIIDYVTGGKPLPDAVVDELVRKSEGVPLFAEEGTRMVIESDLVRLEHDRYVLAKPMATVKLGIPATIQDTIMARLDNLAAAKPVAQLGATIGRDFTQALVRAVWEGDAPALKKGLNKLVSVELLQRKGLLSRANYRFKHALQRDALYESLGNRDRKHNHQRISEILESNAKFKAIAETQPELLAHHYSLAGRRARDKAIHYWLEASRLATRKFANVEAIRHAKEGLELVAKMRKGAARDELELELQTALIPPLLAVKGWASEELGAAYMRSKELSQTEALECSPKRFPVLRGVWSYTMVGAKLELARPLAAELLELAESHDDDDYRIEAHAAMGDTLFWLGEPGPALEHMMAGLELYDPEIHHEPHSLAYGEDPGAICLCYAALSAWLLGEPDDAEELAQTSLAWVDEFTQPFSRGFLLFAIAWHYVQIGDPEAVERETQRLIALSKEHKFVTWAAAALAMQGWARAAVGQLDEGIDKMIEGRRQWHATGSGVKAGFYPGLIAEAMAKADRVDEAREWIETGIRDGLEHKDAYWRSELYRLRAELRARQGASAEEVAADYDEAARIADEQGAVALRARVDASRAAQGG